MIHPEPHLWLDERLGQFIIGNHRSKKDGSPLMPAGLTDSILKFVSSPPAQLAAGAVLGGLVWKTFQSAENLLNPTVKDRIADWLSGVEVGPKLGRWHDQLRNAISGFGDWDSEEKEGAIILLFPLY